MTQPGGDVSRHTVIWEAISDFSGLFKGYKDARRESSLTSEQARRDSESHSKSIDKVTESERRRARTTQTSNQEVKASYEAARKSIEDLTGRIDKLGESSSKPRSNFLSDMVSKLALASKAEKEFREEVRKTNDEIDRGLRRDTSNDTVGRHSKSLGGDGGRHRILDDLETDDGSTRRRSTGGGGGGEPPKKRGFNIGGGSDRSSTRIAGVSFGTTELGGVVVLLSKIVAIGASIAPLISLIGSLGGAAVGAANALGSLAGAAAAIPGLFAAGATGIGAILVAMKPMSSIFDAYKKSQDAAGAGARERAQNEKDAADKVQDAQRSYTTAERSVSDAQYDAAKAQDNLNMVRRDALISLQDLRMELEHTKLDEEGAALSLQRAEVEYKKVLADPNATLLDREEALHRVKEAQLADRDAKVKNNRTQVELNDSEKRGVDLNRNVIDATRQRDMAQRGVNDALNNAAKAARDLAKAQKEQAAGGSQALAAQQALQDALDKASPSTRKVAEALISMNDGWKDIQKNVSEKLFAPVVGQLGNLRSLLPTVNSLLSDSAGVIGEVAAKGLAMISSGPWKADFATLSANNVKILGSLGNAALSVADAFRNITIAAAPFTEWVAKAVERVAAGFADWAKRARESGDIVRFLEVTEDRISQLWRIVKNVGSVFVSLYNASKPFTDWFLDSIEKMTVTWRAWGKSAEKDGSGFRAWLENIKPLLAAAALLIGDVTKAFAAIASNPDNIKVATDTLDNLRNNVLPPLKRVLDSLGNSGVLESVSKSLGTILGVVADFLEGGGAQGLKTFVTVMTGFVEVLGKLMAIPGVIPVIGGITAGLGALAALRLITGFPLLKQLIEGLGWILRNKVGFMGVLRELGPALLGAFKNVPKLLLRSIGLGGLLGNAKKAEKEGEESDSSSRKGRRTSTSREGRTTSRLPDEARGIGSGGWNRKGQSAATALYVIPVRGTLGDRDSSDRNNRSIDLDENGRAAPDEDGRGRHRAVEPKGRLRRIGGKVGGGLLSTVGLGLDLFGLPDVTNWFGGGKDKSSTGDVPEDIDLANKRPIKAVSEGESGAKRFLKRVPKEGNLKSLAIGTAVAGGSVIGEDLLGKRLDDRQNDWLTAGSNIAGGASTGAFIGGAIGSVVPVLGTAVGGAVGGVVGGGIAAAGELKNNKTVREDVSKAWDKTYEGFMNSVGSPIAKWFREMLPKAFDNVSAFFTKTLPSFLGDVTSFFTQTLPNAIGGFFTNTLPKWFDNLGDFFIKLPDRIAVAVGTMAADLEHFITVDIPEFFTETIPDWFEGVGDAIASAWDNVSDFFTKDVPDFFLNVMPAWFESIGSAIGGWWSGSVVPFFTKDVPNFFINVIPAWFESMGAAVGRVWSGSVVPFFTKDVPHFFTRTIPHWFAGLLNGVRSGWRAVSTFFTTTVPNFFTQTIPKWFHALVNGVKSGWNSVVEFFTKDVPGFFLNIIPGWFKGIGDAISKDVVQPIADFFGGAWKYIKKLLGKSGKAYDQEQEKLKQQDAAGHMNGGKIGRAKGGLIPGTYSGREDNTLIRATPGEFMIRRRVSQKPGAEALFNAFNNESIDPAKVWALLSPEEFTGGMGGSSFKDVFSVPPANAEASRSVHNSNTNVSRQMQFGDTIINNPVRETSDRSIRRTVQTLRQRYDTEDD